MQNRSEEELAELIAALRPAPAAWVQAACELPAARAAIDGIVARSLADSAARDAVLADLEAALHGAGVKPRPQLVDLLRSRLAAS